MAVYGRHGEIVFENCDGTTTSIDVGESQWSQIADIDKYYLVDGICYKRTGDGGRITTGEYTIHEIEGPFDDCYCGSEPPEPPEPPKPIIKKREGDTEYYEKINCEFADAVYNKAMSDRYGVEFCCEKDLQRLTIKKKLLDAGQLQDDIDLCEI